MKIQDFKETFRIAKKYKYKINREIGIHLEDESGSRDLRLTSYGDSLKELLEDAVIEEIGDDGKEFHCYDLLHASDNVRIKAYAIIERFVGETR